MSEKSTNRTIPADVLRVLLAKSGGYCQNPTCNDDLYPLITQGSLATIREAAHIIAFSKDGPRGAEELKTEEVNSFENLILLCPTCHTKIDKASHLFSVELLVKWKKDHEEKILACFNAPIFDSIEDLSREVLFLLAQNKACFDTYGPCSKNRDSLFSDAPHMWSHYALRTIIPNNRQILNILRKNHSYFGCKEVDIIEKFAAHKEGFEYNHLSGNKNTSVPLFPLEIHSIFQEKN